LRAVRDDGYDDVVACTVPPIDSFKDFSLSVVADIPVASLKESISGQSYISVVNPQTLNAVETMYQSSVIPADLDWAPAKSYNLAIQIPSGLSYSDLEPGPNSVGQQTRHWTVDPGSYVSVAMEDQQRHSLLDVIQQVLLIVSGILFGLFPASLALATRARRNRHVTSAAIPKQSAQSTGT
jgi:hypothetical protein